MNPREVLQYAMSNTFLDFVNTNPVLPVWPPPDLDPKRTKQAFTQHLDGICTQACINSAYYLTKEFPHTFAFCSLLTAYSHPQSAISKLRYYDNHHTYLLTQDQRGHWYAISPANYFPSNPTQHTRILAEKSLNTLLYQIQALDKGLWPPSTHIHNSSRLKRFLTPQITPKGLLMLNICQNDLKFLSAPTLFNYNYFLRHKVHSD